MSGTTKRDSADGQKALRPLGQGPTTVTPAVTARIHDAIRAERGVAAALRAFPTLRREALAAGFVLVLALLVLAATPRGDLATYPGHRMLLALGLLAVAAAGALRGTLRPLHRPAAPASQWLPIFLGVLFVPLALAILPDAYTGAPLHAHVTVPVLDAAWRCLVFGVVTGAPFVVAARFLDRTGLRLHSHLHFAGAAAALAGNLNLQLHCPITDPLHLVLGHATVVAPFVVFELLALKKM